MSLEPFERKQLNAPDGPTIWVVEITPTRLIYEIQALFGEFFLVTQRFLE